MVMLHTKDLLVEYSRYYSIALVFYSLLTLVIPLIFYEFIISSKHVM